MKSTVLSLLVVLAIAGCDDKKDNPLQGTEWRRDVGVNTEYMDFENAVLMSRLSKDTDETCYTLLYSDAYEVDGSRLNLETGNFHFKLIADSLYIIDLGGGRAGYKEFAINDTLLADSVCLGKPRAPVSN